MQINLFHIPIHICNIDVDKIKINNKNFKKTWLSETLSSHNFPNQLEENDAIYLLQTIAKELSSNIKEAFHIRLHSIWENRYGKNDYQEKHDHPGSHFSFIIYKDVKESNTVFANPADKLIASYYYNMDIKLFEESFIPQCRSGQMIIFPSFLEHMVLKHNDSVTIAGNVLIEKNDSIHR